MNDATPSPYIFDATEANFDTDVVDASFKQPVLVDLWATWCGPCKTLGPILEKVVAEYKGAVRLAKVDCDKQQALAASFGVRSIPTVALLRDGQLVDAFTGALPEKAVREFLARHVAPPPAEPEPAEEPKSAVAESPQQAIARLRQQIAVEPDKAELKLDLALAEMRAGNRAAAEAELAHLPATLESDERTKRLRGMIEFAAALDGAPPAAELEARIARDPKDFAARDLLGIRRITDGNAAAGFEQFLAILAADRHWNDGLARRRLVAAFAFVDDNAAIGDARRKMSSLLF
ncbi:MAG: thioredoxin [Lysobacterales bacterium]